MTEMCVLRDDADPEGFIINHSAITEINRIARAAHMEENFTIVQQSFFARKPSTESIPRTLLSSGDIVSGNLIKHDSVTSGFSQNSSTSCVSHLGSCRSVDSNISQSSGCVHRYV